MTQYPYLFIDRDGTLIEEPLPDRQVDSLAKLRLMPHVITSLQHALQAGYRLVMITNQDGLGTNSFPLEDFNKPQAFLLDLFSTQGIEFEDILICPHFEHENCACRKPKTGLLRPLLEQGVIDYRRSAVVGDRDTDLLLAENVGIQGFKYDPESCSWPEIITRLLDIPRVAQVVRKTRETKVEVSVNLDLSGNISISTGQPFFDHMLEQIAVHAGISLIVKCKGDWIIDDHHSVEDCAIVLGQALRRALGTKHQITRYGFTLPMDECLAQCALDLSGRPYASIEAKFSRERVGGLSCEMIPHFFRSLADAAAICIHLSVTQGNAHHQIEALFKAFGRALGQAIRPDDRIIGSSKGVLA